MGSGRCGNLIIRAANTLSSSVSTEEGQGRQERATPGRDGVPVPRRAAYGAQMGFLQSWEPQIELLNFLRLFFLLFFPIRFYKHLLWFLSQEWQPASDG